MAVTRLMLLLTLLSLWVNPVAAQEIEEAADTDAALEKSEEPVVVAPGEEKAPATIGDLNSRDTKGSAYTMPANTWGLDVDLLGSGVNDLYANVGVNYAFKHGVQVGVNLAHISTGLINFNLKWNFWEQGPFALAARFSPTWIHGDWVWVLRVGAGGDAISLVDVLVLNSSVLATYRPTKLLQFDLGARYMGSRVFGSLDSDSVLLDAQLAIQQFALDPEVRLYLGDRFTLSLGARLPLWTRLPGSADAEISIGDNIVAGGSTAGTYSPKFADLYQVSFDTRTMVKEGIYLSMGLRYGKLNHQIYGATLYPQMGMEFRF